MFSLRSEITKDILSYFFLNDQKPAYVNDLSRRLQHDSGNLSRKLTELEREGLLKSDYKGNLKYYSLNKKYPLLSEYKKIFQKTLGIEQELKQSLISIEGLGTAFIFGSYATNKMDPMSDIDLLLVGNHKVLDVQRQISSLQKKIDREINCINMDSEEFKRKEEAGDPFITNFKRSKKIKLI